MVAWREFRPGATRLVLAASSCAKSQWQLMCSYRYPHVRELMN